MTCRTATAALVIAIAATVAGCADQVAPAPPAAPTERYAAPLPAKATLGAASAAPTTSSTPDPNCTDPTRSLRPAPDQLQRGGPTVDAIRARGRLLVGLDAGSNLFSFRDPLTGTIQGFDVDIAKEIARDLFGDPNRIEYRILGSAQRERALQDNIVDIVSKTMTITCERRERVDFSTVYFQANQRVLAVADSGIGGIDDLAGKKVCVVEGTTSLQHIRRLQPSASILTVTNWADCLVVLQQRQVDAVSTDDSILAGLAVQDPYARVVGRSISTEPYGIGISKNKDDLVRFVNATLDRVRADGTWNSIYDRWLVVLGPSPGPPAPRYLD